VLFITAGPIFLLYRLFGGKKLPNISQRLGFFRSQVPRTNSGNILWFHAASVGEVQVVKALLTWVDQLFPDGHYVVTTVTEQGQKVAMEQLAPFGAHCFYAPVDLPWVVKRFIKELQPSAYICLETELWPNMIKVAAASGVKLLLLNGRISENSFNNYRKIRPLLKSTLNKFLQISTIMAHDRDRFIALGAQASKVVINGNAKYDTQHHCQALSKTRPALSKKNESYAGEIISYYRQRLTIAPNQPVFMAGSTHGGEEEILLDVFKKLKREIPDLLLILAPRHLERLKQLQELLESRDLNFVSFSDLTCGSRTAEIILLDSMGDLASLYSISTYAFCGGSLVPKGGHNLMEPAIWGVPAIYGRYMADFRDAKNMLESAAAGFQVESELELYDKIIYLHHHSVQYNKASEAAKNIALLQQGAARRQAKLIQEVINNS